MGVHLASALSGADGLAGNVSVLAIFASLVAAGIMRGVKEVREFRGQHDTKSVAKLADDFDKQVAAVTLLENATLSAWTASNKQVAEQLGRTGDLIQKLHDELCDSRHGTADLRHAIDELVEVMRHRGR